MAVSSKLTLNYGLRYEQMGPWSERYDRLSVLQPTVPNEVASASGRSLYGQAGTGKLARQPEPEQPEAGAIFSRHVLGLHTGWTTRPSSEVAMASFTSRMMSGGIWCRITTR